MAVASMDIIAEILKRRAVRLKRLMLSVILAVGCVGLLVWNFPHLGM